MKQALVIAALMMIPASASPQASASRRTSPIQRCLTDVALNAAPGARTFRWPCAVSSSAPSTASGFDKAIVWVHYTHVNDGKLRLNCTNSDDGGVTQSTPQVCPSGVCVDSGKFETSAVLTAGKDWSVIMQIAGHPEGECIVTHDGAPGAGDTVIVNWRMFTDGGA